MEDGDILRKCRALSGLGRWWGRGSRGLAAPGWYVGPFQGGGEGVVCGGWVMVVVGQVGQVGQVGESGRGVAVASSRAGVLAVSWLPGLVASGWYVGPFQAGKGCDSVTG